MISNGENIDCVGEWKQSLLMKAIQGGKEELAIYFINQNADVKKVDEDNSSAFFKTSFYGLTKVAKILFDNGVDINQRGYREMTTLMMASNRNHLDLVKYLIEKGADVNLQCDSGYTALTYTSSPDILAYLLSKNADPELKNFEGKNALENFKWSLEDIKGYGTEEMIKNYEKIVEILENKKY